MRRKKIMIIVNIGLETPIKVNERYIYATVHYNTFHFHNASCFTHTIALNIIKVLNISIPLFI